MSWTIAVSDIMDMHAPIRTYRPKTARSNSTWVPPELIIARQKRDRLHRAHRRHPESNVLLTLFRDARRDAKRLKRTCKTTYYQHLFASCTNQPRTTWKVLNSLTGRSRQHEPVPLQPSTLADQFASVVADPGRPHPLAMPNGPDLENGLSSFSPPTTEDIERLLRNLPVRKATGSDGIPCVFLKSCASALAPSLLKLMELSLC